MPPGLGAVIDKGEGIPARAEVDPDFAGAAVEFGEDGVGADAAEPVGGIAFVGFLAMDDAVPETAVGGLDALRNLVRFVDAGEVKIESGHGGLGRPRIGKQRARRAGLDARTGILRTAAAERQRHEALAGAIQSENGRDGFAVSRWIEHASNLAHMTALVLSAGGLWAAWEVGAWKVLSRTFQPDLIVGASAGSWTGWMIASGASPDDLEREYLDPSAGEVVRLGISRSGFLCAAPLHAKAKQLFERYRPRIPFALTLVEVPSLRVRVVRDREITAEHLAASCSIPVAYPPVRIGGKLHVDGGFRGALPLAAAEALGADRAIALNVLTPFPFRLLRAVTRAPKASGKLAVVRLEPSAPLGSLKAALVWSRSNIERWIAQGERDAKLAATSITM